jgi:hypothetical protein
MPHYLRENVRELKKLYTDGMDVRWCVEEGGNRSYLPQHHSRIKVTLLCIGADSKGKPPIIGTFGFNKKEGGCTVCSHPCTWMEALNKGVYLEKDLVTGVDTTAVIFDGYADMKENYPNRIKISSPLIHLEYFDLCKQVPLDAMHICWLGVIFPHI